ncbi:MAG: hypothetical protein ACK5QC_15245 [Bacteroidota bacterium]
MNNELLLANFSDFYKENFSKIISRNRVFFKEINNPYLEYTQIINANQLNSKLILWFNQYGFKPNIKIKFLGNLIIHLKIEIEFTKKHIKWLIDNFKGVEQENHWFINEIEQLIKFIASEIQKIKTELTNKEYIPENKKSKKGILPSKGFYIKKPAQKKFLKDIHFSLTEKNYIDKKTELKDFKKLFNNANASDIKPINWLGSISSLKHLIKLLKIDSKGIERDNKIIISFTVKGKEITLRQLKNNKQSETKSTKNLDIIFKHYPSN